MCADIDKKPVFIYAFKKSCGPSKLRDQGLKYRGKIVRPHGIKK